jgi:ribonuclease BN (tRNA processing enzyme)
LKVTFLGSGGAFCDYRTNYHNNALVEVGDTRVLLDCGGTACQSLRELDLHPTELDAVAFTHLHADHASPEQLIWERMFTGRNGPAAWLPTPLLAPESVLHPLMHSLEPFVGVWRDEAGRTREDGVDHCIRADATHRIQLGGLNLRWFRVPHVQGGGVSKDAFGLELVTDRRRVVWSGDKVFTRDWLIGLAEDPDVHTIFHECTFSAPFQGTVHTHYAELCTLPRVLRQKIILMHHTRVPDGEDPLAAGFGGAAERHQVFEL